MQLTDQINSIRARNELMTKLNDIQTVLTEVKAKFGKTDADAKFADIGRITHELIAGSNADGTETEKSQLDLMSGSSQMDMVRLLLLNNKRTEAFDTMINSLQEQQDNKSSIVGIFR